MLCLTCTAATLNYSLCYFILLFFFAYAALNLKPSSTGNQKQETPPSAFYHCLSSHCQRRDSEVRGGIVKSCLLLIIVLGRGRRRAGAGEKEVKIAALETSDCQMKPTCSLYPDLRKTLPKDVRVQRGPIKQKCFQSFLAFFCSDMYFSSDDCKSTATRFASCVSARLLERKELQREEIKAAGIYQAIRAHCQRREGTGAKRMALIPGREGCGSGNMK